MEANLSRNPSKNQNIKLEILSTLPKKTKEAELFMLLAFCLLKTETSRENEKKYFVFATKNLSFLDALYTLIQTFTPYTFYLDLESEQLFCEDSTTVQYLENQAQKMANTLENGSLTQTIQVMFLRLSFYFWGSFSYTSKNKKIEFKFPKNKKTFFNILQGILRHLNLPFFVEKEKQKVYFQKNESLSLFFAFIQLPKTLLELENEWVVKEMNQNIQRSLNFDDANLKRQAKASEQLMEVFLKHLESPSFHALSEEEQKLVLLRLQHEDYSLSELAQHTVPPKTKSQLHYAFLKIKQKLEQDL